MPPERNRDLAIPHGHFVMVFDRTNGNVNTIAGPNKMSLAGDQVAVTWDGVKMKEHESSFDLAVQRNVTARQGEYVMLQNPGKVKDKCFPESGRNSPPPDLEMGDVVIYNGPVSFALWWQQNATVIPGHKLRSNQFLTLEVTNQKQSGENWGKAVVQKVGGGDPVKKKSSLELDPDKFTMGQRIVICGTDASFFIPPTGMRVVPDEKTGEFVREAVTLESLQYCVLLGEDGVKRFVPGPAVVFPTATETFVETDGSRVSKAIELNSLSGIYVKVISDYKEKGGEEAGKEAVVQAGTELFITGKQQAIYFPRPEHAIITYDKNNIHYAVAVPEGEGRYVLNRETGEVALVKGPKMLLLDPRKEVFIKRPLPKKLVELWFPGNTEALRINAELETERLTSSKIFVEESSRFRSAGAFARGADYGELNVPIGADEIQRRSTHTTPRTITLDTKYQGAVSIGVWAGYATEVVAKNGKRRVVKGPQTVLLEYNEELTRLSLSTGKPKNTDRLQETVYLKIAGNQVSDVVTVETKDGMGIEVKVSYQVEFIGNGDKWFVVDNYVKLVTDHLRSILRGVARQYAVSEFIGNSTVIIRDAVLGKRPETGPRPGCGFPQIDARVYDVEVLLVKPTDPEVARLIADAQKSIITQTLDLTKREQGFVVAKRIEEITRQTTKEKLETAKGEHEKDMMLEGQRLAQALERQKVVLEVERAAQEANLKIQDILAKISAAVLARDKANADQKQAIDTEIQKLEIEKLQAETSALKDRLIAIPEKFVAAIEASNDRDALVKMAEELGLAAYLRKQSVGATIQSLLEGTPLAKTFEKLGTAVRGRSES
ncbi:MAG: hypothetical protein WC250_00180 [Candidatus Paceibacterota bacterium]